MHGFSIQTAALITTVADAHWQIVSAADFNSDGEADLLWRNQATGENVLWQMNSFSIQTTAAITTVPDVNWQIVGTADFNRDATPDLVWRNQATGENVLWQMNSTGFQRTIFSPLYQTRIGRLQALLTWVVIAHPISSGVTMRLRKR